jgi:hypothetical protein
MLVAFDRLDTDLANNVGVANAVGVNVTRVEVGLDEVKVGKQPPRTRHSYSAFSHLTRSE